jgi:hypothetical protein
MQFKPPSNPGWIQPEPEPEQPQQEFPQQQAVRPFIQKLEPQPAIITILTSDTAFQSENCGTWTSDLSQITSSKTSFGDGIYIVTTDIAPGNYKNTASPNCYYARLSAFDTSAIISNNNTDAVAIVTIYASDKGFESHNCGTWTKL